LIAYGRCNSTLELEQIRKHYNVSANNTVIDSSYKANEVYRFCAATGWKPFKGHDARIFLRPSGNSGSWRGRSPKARRSFGTPKRVRLFRWSKLVTKA